MTVHVDIAKSGDTYQFEVGQCITHKEQPMPSLVLYRCKASNGMEMYGVRSFATVDAQRDRMMLGSALRGGVANSSDCCGCLLVDTGLCPGA